MGKAALARLDGDRRRPEAGRHRHRGRPDDRRGGAERLLAGASGGCEPIGRTTAAAWSPRLKRNVGFAWVPSPHMAVRTQLEVDAPQGDEGRDRRGSPVRGSEQGHAEVVSEGPAPSRSTAPPGTTTRPAASPMKASPARRSCSRGSSSGRRVALEVGVGTGQVALPLHDAGIRVVGMDLSSPMLAKLVEKAKGRSPVPLVQADATRMPFRGRCVRCRVPSVGPAPDPRVAGRARRDRPRRRTRRRRPRAPRLGRQGHATGRGPAVGSRSSRASRSSPPGSRGRTTTSWTRR